MQDDASRDAEVVQAKTSPFVDGRLDPVEVGRKGGNAPHDYTKRLGFLREALMANAPDAIDGLGRVVREETTNARVTPAATAILDRIGLGPSSSVDLQVEGSERLALLITQLDKQEELQGSEDGTPALEGSVEDDEVG